MSTEFRTRIRDGVVGMALTFVALAGCGCEQPQPPIDTSTKGGIPGSVPSPEPQKVEIQKKA
jgi:hypothetical protein